jgi:hypothetical protein
VRTCNPLRDWRMFPEHGFDYIDNTQENTRLAIRNHNNYIFN